MSVVTKKEKEALEEVFLSIQNQNQITQKLKNLSSLFFKSKKQFFVYFGNFREQFYNFSSFFLKVKKFLSK